MLSDDELDARQSSNMQSLFKQLRADIAADSEAALDARFSQMSVRADELRTDVDRHE